MVILSGTILFCFTGCVYFSVGYMKDTLYAKKTQKPVFIELFNKA